MGPFFALRWRSSSGVQSRPPVMYPCRRSRKQPALPNPALRPAGEPPPAHTSPIGASEGFLRSTNLLPQLQCCGVVRARSHYRRALILSVVWGTRLKSLVVCMFDKASGQLELSQPSYLNLGLTQAENREPSHESR